MTVRERVADAVRKTDAQQRGVDPTRLLPFPVLGSSEQRRWLMLADAALDAADVETRS
jgi:hypothetical protein